MDEIKIFVSYSHDDDKHKAWVKKLASHLRGHGVDVILDQWDLRLGDDLPFFMEDGLKASHLVLCICSDNYTIKANNRKGGAGYESKILTAELMNDSNRNFVIPIKRNNKDGKIPTYFGAALYIDFNNDDDYYTKYRELLDRITGEDLKKKPQLGKSPYSNETISNAISYNVDSYKIKYTNHALSGSVSFDYKNNNGLFLIGEGDSLFMTQWSEAGNCSIHCYKDKLKRIGYNSKYKDYPSKDEIINFDFSSRCRSIREGEIVILENKNGKFAAVRVTKVFRNSVDIGHLLEFEYYIYDDINK